jgi:(p)ppGpp synthase/HD superfamily hydrolase
LREAGGLRSAESPADLPSFARHLPVTQTAIPFARHLHRTQRRASDDAPFILHPLEVASLLYNCGAPDRVIAAGVLHDVIEDTSAVIEEIRQRFGGQIATLVASVTEDPAIESRRERKAALREQIRCAGEEAALIFAADKVTKVRELRTRVTRVQQAEEPIPTELEAKLEHYRASLGMLEEAIADQPLVRQLRFELEAFQKFPPGLPTDRA